MEKRFPIGHVLSVTTGKLLAPIDNLYKILDYMTGESLYTHELPEYSNKVKPYIFERYPELKEVDDSSVNRDNWEMWLKEQEDKYGKSLLIPKVDVHRTDGPIESFIRIKEELSKK